VSILEIHQEAMHYSFLAKQARISRNEDEALLYYEKAADLETQAANFYLERSDLEPTRSIVIRSAAFLNLKAGLVENAEKFIFWGIINTQDLAIREQLYDALELCLTYRNLTKEQFSGNIDYIYELRRKSIFYVLEPKEPTYGNAVTLDMVSDFSDNFTKSLRAYSESEFHSRLANQYATSERQLSAAQEFRRSIRPLLTNAGFGSFKFSIAVDFLPRLGETASIIQLRSNILLDYHEEIIKNDFSDEKIQILKSKYDADELEDIFRPIFRMRSTKSAYHIGYYDRETLRKHFISKTKNNQRAKLLPIRKVTEDDIGHLESMLSQTYQREGKATHREVIFSQQLTSYEFDKQTNIIEPKGHAPIILNQEILINVKFDSRVGFTFNFEELDLEVTDMHFHDGLNKFYLSFIALIRSLWSRPYDELTDVEQPQFSTLSRLVNNPSDLN
jgi:hypothetical protein